MKKLINIFSLIIAIGALYSCSSNKKEEVAAKTILKIQVYDNEDALFLEDEEAYLFSDEEAYLSSLANKQPFGYDFETIIEGGLATFGNVNPDVRYYIYIHHEKGDYGINNFFENNRLRNGLLIGTTTTVKVKLLPFNVGRLAFWTKSSNEFQLGIEVVFDNESIGSVAIGKAAVPTSVNDPNVLPIFYQEVGDYNWYAKGANGCYWEGSVSVAEETFYPIELESCSMSKVVFTGGSLLSNYTSIEVILGQNDVLGTLTSASAQVGACGTGLEVARAKGTYHYQVLYDDVCVEIGELILAEDCQKVQLKGCDE